MVSSSGHVNVYSGSKYVNDSPTKHTKQKIQNLAVLELIRQSCQNAKIAKFLRESFFHAKNEEMRI